MPALFDNWYQCCLRQMRFCTTAGLLHIEPSIFWT